MPVYTYRCENCGVQFDRSQKFTDAPLTRCPECGQKTLRKVYSPVGIIFKGSGFYSTDYHSPSGQAPAASNHESKESESSSASASSNEKEAGAAKPTSKVEAKAPQPKAEKH